MHCFLFASFVWPIKYCSVRPKNSEKLQLNTFVKPRACGSKNLIFRIHYRSTDPQYHWLTKVSSFILIVKFLRTPNRAVFLSVGQNKLVNRKFYHIKLVLYILLPIMYVSGRNTLKFEKSDRLDPPKSLNDVIQYILPIMSPPVTGNFPNAIIYTWNTPCGSSF